MKIWAAAKRVLEESNSPLSYKDIYYKIVDRKYYVFKAVNPLGVVHGEIRKRCDNLSFATARNTKYFTRHPDGKYGLIGSRKENSSSPLIEEENEHSRLEIRLTKAHDRYLTSFKKVLLEELKNLTPQEFEVFSKNLLLGYGFSNVRVTRLHKDGGIDGDGHLKAGLSKLTVAFQCKRWRDGRIGRVEIDKFRGAIQGQYDQGIFFTTSTFNSGAKAVSTRVGAVPIILVNGEGLVDILLEKKLGVRQEIFAKYSIELDSMLSDED